MASMRTPTATPYPQAEAKDLKTAAKKGKGR
jgi:hypothetical protein